MWSMIKNSAWSKKIFSYHIEPKFEKMVKKVTFGKSFENIILGLLTAVFSCLLLSTFSQKLALAVNKIKKKSVFMNHATGVRHFTGTPHKHIANL